MVTINNSGYLEFDIIPGMKITNWKYDYEGVWTLLPVYM